MADTQLCLQLLIDNLPQYTPEDYYKPLPLRGARTVFNTPVKRRSEPSYVDDTGQERCILLKKSALSDDLQQVVDKVKLWAGGGEFCLWVSHTLPADLNLPWKIVTPQCVITTILFLGVDLHFFVLTLCDNDPQPLGDKTPKPCSWQTAEVQVEGHTFIKDNYEACRDYCKQVAKALTLSLYCFCPSDFCLLPCTLQLSQFSVENLQRELQQQMDHLSLVYGGPRTVNAALYAKLKVAVIAVAGVTYVPCFDENPECSKSQRWLVLMEGDWRDVLSLMIESVYQKSGCSFEYTAYNEGSVKVALLEAALRLSVNHTVIIVTPDDKLRATSNCIVRQAKEFDEQTLNLQVLSSADLTLPPADYVISIDCETGLHCTLPFSNTKRDEQFHFLLLGPTGRGGSTTSPNILVDDGQRGKEVWSPHDQSQQLMKHIQELEIRLDRIEEHIGLIADKVKHEELEKSRQEVAALRERLESALNHIQEKEKQLQDTQDRLTNHANRIQELEGEKRKLSDLVQTLRTQLTTSEKKVLALESKLHVVKKDLQDTKGRLDKTEQHFATMTSKQDQTDMGMKALQAQVAKLAEKTSRAEAATPTDVRMSVAETHREEGPGHGSKLATLGGAALGLPPIRISKNIINSGKPMNFPPPKS